MDFGIGFISTNIMLPILDFFYGIAPSYGFAIVALTLVIRAAVSPLSAGQIRNMRKMRITQPLMKEKQEEIQRKYKDDPQKQREEIGKLMQEFGNPLAGCFPLLLQMPILFALFATLRGSPFTDINYTVDVQVFPQAQMEQIQPQPFSTKTQNIYIDDGVHYKVAAMLPAGKKLIVGQDSQIEFQTESGKSLETLEAEHPDKDIQPIWEVTKGEERIQVNKDGTITPLAAGDATIQATIPGIASEKGFLFIKELGRIGAVSPGGAINWDIVTMVIIFGASMYVNQIISGQSGPDAGQQQAINKFLPILLSGMFLFFPLPAGVLMYIVIANLYQTAQTFFLMREPLPDNLQKIVEQQEKSTRRKEGKGRDELPFERKRSKKKEKPS